MKRLFVFGTLKAGFPLHSRALSNAAYKGSYKTTERFPMFVAGNWFAPMMMNEPGTGHHVFGELYDVEDWRLNLIDEMESIGRPGNLRVTISVEPISGGISRLAMVYMKSRELAVPVHTQCLKEYCDRRFVPPARRANTPLR
jgi:gamma-glutamylaminecyclotransferase